MIISIRTETPETQRVTYDNDSPMAEPGNIAVGTATNGTFIDGQLTKAEAKKEIEKWVKEFLK